LTESASASGGVSVAVTVTGGSQPADQVGPELDGLSAHWRVEARLPGEQGGEMVEVLETSHGLWLVVPAGRSVELHPSTAAQAWRELTHLLARRAA
jgi:hypothetical protein